MIFHSTISYPWRLYDKIQTFLTLVLFSFCDMFLFIYFVYLMKPYNFNLPKAQQIVSVWRAHNFWRMKNKKCLLQIAQINCYTRPTVKKINEIIKRILLNQSFYFPDVQEPHTRLTFKYHCSLSRKFDNIFKYSKRHTLWYVCPVTTAWRFLRLRMEELLSVWRVASNILNKQSRIPTRVCPPAWCFGDVLTNHRSKGFFCELYGMLEACTGQVYLQQQPEN